MRKVFWCVAFLVLLGAGAAPLPAQVRFGGQASWGDERDLGLGARVAFGLSSLAPGTPLEGHASFDYFFPDEPVGTDVSYWEINTNVVYLIPGVRGPLGPYVGGGLNLAHASADVGVVSTSNTEAGLNLVGGTKFKLRAGRVTPFAELRIELGGGDQFVLTAGVLF